MFETNMCSGSVALQYTVFIVELQVENSQLKPDLTLYSLMEHDARMPRIEIPGCENYFSIRICIDELLCKSACWPVANSLTVAQQLVPLRTTERCPSAVVFGCQCMHPHQTVWRILDAGGHHVVCFNISPFIPKTA